MNRSVISFIVLTGIYGLFGCSNVGGQTYEIKIKNYRDSIDRVFSDSRHSILPAKDLQHFEGLNYYPVDPKYRVIVEFRHEEGRPFKMKTTTDRLVVYRKYGTIRFMIDADSLELAVYQNTELTDPEYQDYLFCPFNDLTNGEETYGGGRYLDIRKGDLLKGYIDFNLAYNPYCAYNYKYSCPIPPAENHLSVSIKAGVKEGIIRR